MIHIFTRKLTQMAGSVEQKLFRIERENRLVASVINGVMAGTAVAVVAWVVSTLQRGDLLLFACLGSSAASVVFAPVARTNSLRTIVLAYVLCSPICLVLFAARDWGEAVWVQCFLAVSVSVFLMRVLDAMHPAAVGSALAFIIYERNMQSLVLLLLAIIGLLTIVKVLASIYLQDLTFKTFAREFSRDYYGREVTVTVVNERADEELRGEAANGKVIHTDRVTRPPETDGDGFSDPGEST